MIFIYRLALILALVLPLSVSAQGGDFSRLRAYADYIAAFDHAFPREKVLLHLDNNGYLEGETLYFKAYVLRASTLGAGGVSRVLYVDLLNAEGQQMARRLLRIDSLGGAHGDFPLTLPVRAGYYEIRAYTSEMLNWGDAAYFSRVVPVFCIDSGEKLALPCPEIAQDLSPANTRPFAFGRKKTRALTFYPEGGARVAGVAQRIAYQLTDERGAPCCDTLALYDSSGTLRQRFTPQHEGMGRFVLPPNFEGYVAVHNARERKRFPLPPCDPAAPYALSAESTPGGVTIQVSSTQPAERLLGLAITCRDRLCYFDTLTCGDYTTELSVPAQLLYDGVNRIDLFDAAGESLASRLVWKNTGQRALTLDVKQSAARYAPFSPAALEFTLNDQAGKPVQASFSLAVRDGDADLVRPDSVATWAQLLLFSELRGYIHEPEAYFRPTLSPAEQLRNIDLLLQVQGWRATRFPVLAGRDSFALRYPIEDKLTLAGRVLHDNKRAEPYAGIDLHLQMYSRAGGSLEARALTDSAGRFAFQSKVDYAGDWIAQITTRNEKGNRKWARVAFDHTPVPAARPFGFNEMTLRPPLPTTASAQMPAAQLFTWRDTIPQTLSTQLSEAVVATKGKYRGLTGGRYTYQVGEEAGLRHADFFYDIPHEVARKKDAGEAVGLIWDLIAELNAQFLYEQHAQKEGAPSRIEAERNAVSTQATAQTVEQSAVDAAQEAWEYALKMGSEEAILFVNNALQSYADDIWAEEVKSVVIMTEINNWRRFLTPAQWDAVAARPRLPRYAIFVYTNPDYYLFKTRRGQDKRLITGFAQPTAFYHPDYRRADLPDAYDLRRTLYWMPDVQTDAQGHASAVFFTGALPSTALRISARGVTPAGRCVFLER